MKINNYEVFSLHFRRPFPILHRQFSDLVDSVIDQITSYHDNLISTVILQDAHSHNWADHRPFYEVHCIHEHYMTVELCPVDSNTRDFIKGQTLGKLTDCEDDLTIQRNGFLIKKFFSKRFTHL